MDVFEALRARHSTRAFKPEAIEREKFDALFAAASRTPSWGNTQPWEVFVAQGDTMARIREGYAKSYAEKVMPAPESPRPNQWSEAAQARHKQLPTDMKRDCGDAAMHFGKLNQTLFNAPAVIYICLDRLHSEWSMYDIGAYTQSLMLAAVELGLATIPAITLTLFPDVLRRELGIPDNLRITIGIAIGYADENNGINKFVTSRDPVADVVRFSD
jgi:nitroreductase